jgi:hypothetical protein
MQSQVRILDNNTKYIRFIQTGNENDVTMQAGRQRATLPLIRKFNEHSERLLKAAM